MPHAKSQVVWEVPENQGDAVARRARGRRCELRAHPSLEPGRNGCLAVPTAGRSDLANPCARRHRALRDHGPWNETATATGGDARHLSRERTPREVTLTLRVDIAVDV